MDKGKRRNKKKRSWVLGKEMRKEGPAFHKLASDPSLSWKEYGGVLR